MDVGALQKQAEARGSSESLADWPPFQQGGFARKGPGTSKPRGSK